MWTSLEKPWQMAMDLAWESFKSGSLPIAAVIVDANGQIISAGRNQIFEKGFKNRNMAHMDIAFEKGTVAQVFAILLIHSLPGRYPEAVINLFRGRLPKAYALATQITNENAFSNFAENGANIEEIYNYIEGKLKL
ncbi:MAG: hypothetical protein FWC76_07825 [Defluviitaleaceae bacterium]|nr:hypothetical protein [Defluviitaleaceae bacterium]